jgi:hypothetical protein
MPHNEKEKVSYLCSSTRAMGVLHNAMEEVNRVKKLSTAELHVCSEYFVLCACKVDRLVRGLLFQHLSLLLSTCDSEYLL